MKSTKSTRVNDQLLVHHFSTGDKEKLLYRFEMDHSLSFTSAQVIIDFEIFQHV